MKEEMPALFITLWKSDLDKCFLNKCSSIKYLLATGKQLSGWTDQDIKSKQMWWSVPTESPLYKRNKDKWSYFRKTCCRRFALDNELDTCPLNVSISISVKPVAAGFFIEGAETIFNLLPPTNALSKFENDYTWSNLQEGFDYAINDPTILPDTFVLPEDMCQALIDEIRNGTANILSDGPLILLPYWTSRDVISDPSTVNRMPPKILDKRAELGYQSSSITVGLSQQIGQSYSFSHGTRYSCMPP